MATVTRTVRLRRTRQQAVRGGSRRIVRVSAVVVTIVVALVVALPAAAAATVVGVYTYFAKDLPDASTIEAQFSAQSSTNQQYFETTKIYDRTGQTLLYEIIDANAGDRQWVSLPDISPNVISATVALEDRSFWENPGVDARGLARAFLSNLQGEQVQGASTITQQLIKNTLIPAEERTQVSYERKIKEAILALELTRRYPGREGKQRILEWYLNTNYYGEQAYGIQAAARVYFDIDAKDLTLAQAAMLVAIPQNPAYTPIQDERTAKSRQQIVLNTMADQGYITRAQANLAYRDHLEYHGAEQRYGTIVAPHYAIYAKQSLEELMVSLYGPEAGIDLVNRGGLRVYTALDLALQNEAESIARQHVTALRADGRNATNACVVLLRPNTGEILAMVGSLDYWSKEKRKGADGNEYYLQGTFNVCTGLRQPGSSFKPFAYVTAFAKGLTAATIAPDVNIPFDQGEGMPLYAPENYDLKFHGPQRLRNALARSYNIPAVWVTQQVGVDAVIRTAHNMGITSLDQGLSYYGLALTLGGGEVKPLDMAYAYSVFMNGGYMAGQPVPASRLSRGFRELDPVAILRVEDSQGKILYQYDQPQVRQVLSPQLAWLMTSILSDNQARYAAFGHPNVLELDRPAAVKTGTTNDFRDNWTIGGTPQLVAAVWVGNNDNAQMEHVSGVAGAAPIWHDVVTAYLKDKPVVTWERPDGLVDKYVCDESGLLPTRYCPTVLETFIAGTEPKATDNLYQPFLINKESGKLATVFTPPELIEEKVFPVYPPEYADWVRDNAIPQPPTEYDSVGAPSTCVGEVAICTPTPYSYVHGLVAVNGNARGDGFALYHLTFGKGLNPTGWQQIGPDHGEQVDNNWLENWDTAGLDGLYSLQLTLVRGDSSFQQATIQVTVDNISPTVKLITPLTGSGYSVANDQWATFQVDATDNLSMSRVEWYVDDQVVGTSTVPPFIYKYFLSGHGGGHTVWAVGYDAAGNQQESEKARFAVGP
jgi:membrane peptidoglycan carboxypeptidase